MTDFLARYGSGQQKPKVLMWADTSVRYLSNPQRWAEAMVRDGVDFAGREGMGMGMGENTHDDTYRYFNMSRHDFKDRYAVQGGAFLFNLLSDDAVRNVFEPLLDCGARMCRTCMAPIGSTKGVGETKGNYVGPPSTTYVAHRQDQSATSLLVYDWMTNRGGNVQLRNKDNVGTTSRYFDLTFAKKDVAKSVDEIINH